MQHRRKWHGLATFEGEVFSFAGSGAFGLLTSAEKYTIDNEYNDPTIHSQMDATEFDEALVEYNN